jgi:glycine hydroxymethyltransferase
MKEPEMEQIADLIATALRNRTDAAAIAEVRGRVAALCARFPVYNVG